MTTPKGTTRRVLSAWLARENELNVELVLTMNGVLAIALGIVAWWVMDVPFRWSVVQTGVVFLLLTVAVGLRTLSLLAAALGALASAATLGALAYAFGMKAGVAMAWTGAVVAGALGLWAGWSGYRALTRATKGE